MKDGFKFIFHTPKYRQRLVHYADWSDMVARSFGPFGDIYPAINARRLLPVAWILNPDAQKIGVMTAITSGLTWIPISRLERP